MKRLRLELGRTTNELHDTESELKAEEQELHKAEENGNVGNALDAMAEAMDEMGGDEEGFIGKKAKCGSFFMFKLGPDFGKGNTW